MKSAFIGSAASVLLVFSVISYSKTLNQGQEPKTQQTTQQAQAPSQAATQPSNGQTSTDVVNPETKPAEEASRPASVTSISNLNAPVPTAPRTDSKASEVLTGLLVSPQLYTATAYALRGRTASGRPVNRGLIAADPRVLPLGTRVRVDAGSWSGEYVVADTGGAVRGRRIDIWTPTVREALRFGRRAVKLTVLALGIRKPASARARSRRSS